MVQAYLGLPSSITSLKLAPGGYEGMGSFPRLLEAVKAHAGSRLTGIDLDELAWYHRLRNQLYHQGDGLTVERDKVVVYAKVARELFRALLNSPRPPDVPALGGHGC